MKNWKVTLVVAMIIGLSATSIFAQRDQTLFGRGGLRLTGGWGGTQLMVSSFNGELGALRGGFGMAELNKNFYVGGGGYTSRTYESVDQLGDNYEMSYGGLILGYGAKSYKVVHPQVGVLFGPGWKQQSGFGREDIWVAQPSIGLEFNVLRWFRIGLNAGYRFTIDQNFDGIDNNFSGGYGGVAFKFGWSWGR